jgi:ATP-binding cassette subfamily C exporter for protease/lipase
MPLPPPKGVLTVEAITVAATQGAPTILRNVSFGIKPGDALAVIGPAGSGKTTLARVLIGLWPTLAGKVRLDGVDVHTWDKDELGPHVGYLPQSIELFDGTIAENIARMGKVDLGAGAEPRPRWPG